VAGPTPQDVLTRHSRDVYCYLARMTGRPDVADDLSQQVFLLKEVGGLTYDEIAASCGCDV
jgi:DNA-directed RNA polymerase specialized sigma24 family protein